jgi:hypothetical protein
MPYYRLYFMNPGDGHIQRFEDFVELNDRAALTRAEQKLDGQPLELWQEARKVRRFEPLAAGVHALNVWQQRSDAR